MKEKITPCVWHNQTGKEAAALYCRLFNDTKIVSESPYVTNLSFSGQLLMLLDGGPQYKPNPSISFFYICETQEELDRIWHGLLPNGTVLMPLGQYPWSDRYGWITDAYGTSWQLSVGKLADVGQKLTPCLMFTGDQLGRAEEALQYYSSIFKNTAIDGILYDEQNKRYVMHAQFALEGQKFMVMDSDEDHQFSFTDGVSLTIHCNTQEEIDYFWNHLTEGGSESMCGWLKDKFGVSWQVVPTILETLMQNPEKAGKAAKAFMSMRKLEIEQIVQATLV